MGCRRPSNNTAARITDVCEQFDAHESAVHVAYSTAVCPKLSLVGKQWFLRVQPTSLVLYLLAQNTRILSVPHTRYL